MQLRAVSRRFVTRMLNAKHVDTIENPSGVLWRHPGQKAETYAFKAAYQAGLHCCKYGSLLQSVMAQAFG